MFEVQGALQAMASSGLSTTRSLRVLRPQITRITPEMTAALATIPYHRSIATMRRIVCALNSMVISAGSVASTTAKEKAAEPNS